jgi:hypothetical protein
MKLLLKNTLCICAILLFSCATNSNINAHSVSSYRHLGMNDILVNGERVHVHFSPNSSREKVLRLISLNPLIPDDHFIYVGILHDEWHTVPEKDGDGNLLLESGEKFRYFDLLHWCVMCPFEYNIGAEKYGDRIEFVTRKQLEESDFGYKGTDSFHIGDYMIYTGDINYKELK